MPASTILLLESDADSRPRPSPRSCPTPGTRSPLATDPDDAFAKAADHQLVIIDIVGGREVRGRALPRDPGRRPRWRPCRSCASARPRTSRSGSASSRPAPTTSWPGRSTHASSRPGSRRCSSASSARRTSTPIVSHGRRDHAPGAPHGRRLQPEGRRRDDDVATNIAIAAAAQRPDRVVLVDLALQFGGVATLLNLDPKQTLADVVRDEAVAARARAAPDLRDAPRQRPARPRRAGRPGGGRDRDPGPRHADPDDAARGLRPGRHRRRARRSTSGPSRSSRRPRGPPPDHARRSARSRRCTPCSSTWARPARSG